MLRKIIVPQTDQYLIRLPNQYINKQIEVLIFPHDLEDEPEFDEAETCDQRERPTEEDQRLFWASFGSWQDERSAEEIIAEIYAARTSTERAVQL